MEPLAQAAVSQADSTSECHPEAVPHGWETLDSGALGVLFASAAFNSQSAPRHDPGAALLPLRAPIVAVLPSRTASSPAQPPPSAEGPLSRFRRRVDLLLGQRRGPNAEIEPWAKPRPVKPALRPPRLTDAQMQHVLQSIKRQRELTPLQPTRSQQLNLPQRPKPQESGLPRRVKQPSAEQPVAPRQVSQSQQASPPGQVAKVSTGNRARKPAKARTGNAPRQPVKPRQATAPGG